MHCPVRSLRFTASPLQSIGLISSGRLFRRLPSHDFAPATGRGIFLSKNSCELKTHVPVQLCTGHSIRIPMAQSARDSLEVERSFLRALCVAPLSHRERDAILRSLAKYNWGSPDHRVIYEALRRSRQPSSDALREHIIAEVTRLGFPDIDIAPYFAPAELSKTDVEELTNVLLAADPGVRDTK